jgi:hypothetical protein
VTGGAEGVKLRRRGEEKRRRAMTTIGAFPKRGKKLAGLYNFALIISTTKTDEHFVSSY